MCHKNDNLRDSSGYESDDDDGEDLGGALLEEKQIRSHSSVCYDGVLLKEVRLQSGHQLRGKWRKIWAVYDYYNFANGYVHIPHFVRATFNFLKVLNL